MATMSAFQVYKGEEKEEEDSNESIVSKKKRKKRAKDSSDNSNKRKKRKILKSFDAGNKNSRNVTKGSKKLMKIKHKTNSFSSIEEEEESEEQADDTESLSSDEGKEGCVPNFDVPFKNQFKPDQYEDSRAAGKALFQLLIYPFSCDKFYKNDWEQKPVMIPRNVPHYNDGWFSSRDLDRILRENHIEHLVNIRITSYADGEKEVEQSSGRAHAPMVWDRFSDGYSIQFLNPQTYSRPMWLLTSFLQEHFSSFVGANIYLTPAGTQGFAPHYDDIEAFVVQVEGKKRWRLYKPRNRYEILPRTSSNDLDEEEIGKPILDIILNPGDLLYFPRGVIHQAVALPDTHSLHITLSTAQKHTWGDFFERMLPLALKSAIEEDEDFRHSLPWDYSDYVGFVHGNSKDKRICQFFDKTHDLFSRIVQYAPLLSAADEMAVDFLHSSLPPCLSENEKKCMIYNRGPSLEEDGKVTHQTMITLDTMIKIVRQKSVRLTNDGSEYSLYFNTGNTRIYKEKDPQVIVLEEEDAMAIQFLIKSYPKFVYVRDLPLDLDLKKTSLCLTLYEQGIIICC
ncbi:PREDICTED: bifunctional lysine-specific demethylase and histidyl-hydroxylase NO66-like [Amphimedon queenslandica]|uniref:Bifunctional lysine-specific demethylase and histidyl-hydroxylase n=1 Tax=Amphimedon queenslandica TaxID=400682 RepID=A0A1X7VN65_AMPQE|nr:PREDICTED: bifunctional lysine-specific demethylase and histidyl-hydroxylase NO66-like [Amphimedon queenslandica]|eukprot:XP_019864286.1 PREDICTED: bifunctional lysine-specific demethylase and histidyl-hydroxylase NO66-like [Amphimedon queenslandica]